MVRLQLSVWMRLGIWELQQWTQQNLNAMCITQSARNPGRFSPEDSMFPTEKKYRDTTKVSFASLLFLHILTFLVLYYE